MFKRLTIQVQVNFKVLKRKSAFLQSGFDRKLYFCTEKGEVWSYARKRGFYFGPEKTLRPSTTQRGYLMVALCIDGKILHYLVHQCIWQFFNRPLKEGEEINHKNGDKLDNTLSNLEVTDRAGNAMHAYRTGLFKYNRSKTTGRFDKLCK